MICATSFQMGDSPVRGTSVFPQRLRGIPAKGGEGDQINKKIAQLDSHESDVQTAPFYNDTESLQSVVEYEWNNK